jgi:hypothetical protein
MRKMLIAAALGLVVLVAPGSARAGVHVSVGIGLPFPPVAFVGPAPCHPRVYYGGPVYRRPVYYGPRYRSVRHYADAPRGWYKRHRRHHRGWDGDWDD